MARSRPASPSKPIKHSQPRLVPRDRYLVALLFLFLSLCCIFFLAAQTIRSDLPVWHPAGGTIKEKAEDEEDGEDEVQYVEEAGDQNGNKIVVEPAQAQYRVAGLQVAFDDDDEDEPPSTTKGLGVDD